MDQNNTEVKIKFKRRIICPECQTVLLDDIDAGVKIKIVCNHCKRVSLLLEGTEKGIRMNIWYIN